jgi:hypothetical protein
LARRGLCVRTIIRNERNHQAVLFERDAAAAEALDAWDMAQAAREAQHAVSAPSSPTTKTTYAVGDTAVIWSVPYLDPMYDPEPCEYTLDSCHGGEALGWWQYPRTSEVFPRAGRLLLAESNGLPKRLGELEFFSKADALDWCIAELAKQDTVIRARLAELRRQKQAAQTPSEPPTHLTPAQHRAIAEWQRL